MNYKFDLALFVAAIGVLVSATAFAGSTSQSVPEPAALGLFGISAGALIVVKLLRRK